ncbi:MAG: FAD-dependent oxidoreductase [Erysipelotrichaceae bacterium]|nr:FAD-dependent oxidoreductase [Erysipelotrichaceae bacterium]
MKRFIAVLLCGLMLMTGCTTAPVEPTPDPVTKMTPGTYTSVGTGYKGDIKLDVTVTEDAITDITVVEHKESMGIGAEALDVLVEEVLKYQTTGVDSITGATVTSYAFKSTVKGALEQAGADLEQFTAKVDVEAQEKTIDADVVVVGGGAAGMMSALYAANEGLNVVLVEKSGIVGGASAMAGGSLSAVYTEEAREELKNRIMTTGHNYAHVPTVELYTNFVEENTNWIMAEDGGNIAYTGENGKFSIEGGGAGAMVNAKANLEKAGVEVLTATPATELIVTDGVVTGVKAQSVEFNYTINAKAVILATGGYAHNAEKCPDKYEGFIYAGHAGHNGDALDMVKVVDAATRNLELVNTQPNTMVLPNGAAQYTNFGSGAVYKMSGILINQDGVRFARESGADWELMQEMAKNEITYLLMDQENFDAFNNGMIGRKLYTAEDVEKWISDDYKGNPFYKAASSLDELAAEINVPADALKATVAKYNEAVNTGAEDEFGRTLTTTIAEEGSYYAIELRVRYYTSLGGLCINENMQVLNTAEEAIPGLYAAGEVVGGIMGDLYVGGQTYNWAMTSGVEAGKSVTKALSE